LDGINLKSNIYCNFGTLRTGWKPVPQGRVLALLLSCILLSCIFSIPVSAQADTWKLTTADFKTPRVAIKGIDSNGLKVASSDSDQPQTIPLDQFLDAGRGGSPTITSLAKFVLQLNGGDRLFGEPVNLTAEAIIWKNPTLGEVAIPTARMLGVTRGAPVSLDRAGREDVVTLLNGDSVHGIIASITSEKVTVQAAGNANTDVPLSSVATINFAATPGNNAIQHGFRIRIDDGSSLVGSEARLDAGNLVLALGKNVEREIALSHVVAIEQVNGPVSWLSSRPPSEMIYYPFIGPQRQPAAFIDRRWDSAAPIEFKGEPFAHGISVHAFSRLAWPLDGKYAAFRTLYAVEGDSSLADVTVRIKLDDKVVYEQKHVRAGVISQPIVQDLNGAKALTLEVDGGAAYAQDALDWIEPALVKNSAK
jgi:hypothetical protein